MRDQNAIFLGHPPNTYTDVLFTNLGPYEKEPVRVHRRWIFKSA